MDGPSLVFNPIFKYLVSSVLHGNLLCRHLQIIFISTAVILPKLYNVYIVHHIELQCWYLAMHPKTHGKVVEIAKGQLNSEWIYEVIVSPKMPTKNCKDFCPTKQTRIVAKKPAYNHQKITKKSATILVCLVGQKSL